jgi:hypothetical protein
MGQRQLKQYNSSSNRGVTSQTVSSLILVTPGADGRTWRSRNEKKSMDFGEKPFADTKVHARRNTTEIQESCSTPGKNVIVPMTQQQHKVYLDVAQVPSLSKQGEPDKTPLCLDSNFTNSKKQLDKGSFNWHNLKQRLDKGRFNPSKVQKLSKAGAHLKNVSMGVDHHQVQKQYKVYQHMAAEKDTSLLSLSNNDQGSLLSSVYESAAHQVPSPLMISKYIQIVSKTGTIADFVTKQTNSQQDQVSQNPAIDTDVSDSQQLSSSLYDANSMVAKKVCGNVKSCKVKTRNTSNLYLNYHELFVLFLLLTQFLSGKNYFVSFSIKL